MEENVKNLCAPIPAGLHARVREEQEVSEKHWASIWPG